MVLAAYAASPGGPAHLVLAVIRVGVPQLVMATQRAPEPIRRVLWGVRPRPRDDWARTALLISGLVTFLTLFHFLATGFVEPLHTLVVIVLFPMFVLAVWRAPSSPRWPRTVDGPSNSSGVAPCGDNCSSSVWAVAYALPER
jgi:hypothetical protein